MKPCSLALLLAGSHLSQITKATVVSDIDNRSLSLVADSDHESSVSQLGAPPNLNLELDCNKLVDQLVGFISKYPEYASYAVGITSGSSAAYFACRALNKERCSDVAPAVGSTIAFIVWTSKMLQEPITKDAKSITIHSRRRALVSRSSSIRSQIEGHLREQEIDFESVEDLTHLQARRNGISPALTFEIRSLKRSDAESPYDHRITILDDNKGHVQLTPSAGRVTAPGKRSDGAGFKISYDLVESGFGRPDYDAYKFLSESVSWDWALRADGLDMGDYIGQLELGGTGSIRFRIIPEMTGFGDGYEDVNMCNVP